MVDLGAYPGLIPGSDAVVGEVVEVDPSQLMALDAYEGAPALFARERAELEDGSSAWVYIYQRALPGEDLPTVRGSDWMKNEV